MEINNSVLSVLYNYLFLLTLYIAFPYFENNKKTLECSRV